MLLGGKLLVVTIDRLDYYNKTNICILSKVVCYNTQHYWYNIKMN